MKVYYLKVPTQTKIQQELLEALWAKAPACYAAVLKKVEVQKQIKDQSRSLCAYLLLAYAYAQCFGEAEAYKMPEIIKMAEGKPFFEGADSVHFNLSHSGDYVVCAIAKEACGVDVQEIRPFKERFAQRFFSEKEQQHMEKAISCGRHPDAIGAEIWCKKESLGKCRGYGLTEGTHALDTESCAEHIGVSHVLEEEGYILSYCSLEKKDVRIQEVEYSELESWLFRDEIICEI